MTVQRVTGKVSWFSDAKGYGFLEVDGEPNNVFVHYSEIVAAGYRKLETGQSVELTVVYGEKGPQAKEVLVVDTEDVQGAAVKEAFG